MKKNIVFYCHNFGGLGHTKRVSLIINEIIQNFGTFYNVIFLNSGKKQDFLLKNLKGLKIINLPNYEIENYEIKNPNKISLYRKNIFKKLFSIGNMEKVIIEHYPFGRNFLDEEIRYLIQIFKKNNKEGIVFSSVRDIFDITSLNEVNLNLFDRFLIHGDKKIINYDNIFPKNIENKFIYTGYILNKSIIDKKNENFILISLGGGQDGLEYVLDFLNKFKLLKINYKILINLGLNYNNKNILTIKNIGVGNIEIKDYFEDFLDLKIKAKLIVSMGGYNNFIENIYYDKTSLIYTREVDLEQQKRLKTFIGNYDNIFNAKQITSIELGKILLIGKNTSKKNININFNGAYFSASFIFNYKKYKYIKIRPTNACNAKCKMCGVIKRKRKYNNIINLKDSIVDFYKLGGDVLNFTGGEPTIYKGFWDLLKISKGLGFINSVSTNGSTLGKSFFKNLYFNGIKLIDYIDISVDGLYGLQDTRRNFDQLFKIIDLNLPILIKNNIYVHINITIRNDNILEMIDIFNYFKGTKINSISFGMITSSPFNDNNELIPSFKEIKKFYNNDKKYIIENSGNINVTFSPDYKIGNFDIFVKNIQNKNSFPKKKGKKCDFIFSKKELRINEGGDLSPCCEIDDFDYGIGNINNSNLLNIVCSTEYEDFLNRKQPNISKACLNCKIEI